MCDIGPNHCFIHFPKSGGHTVRVALEQVGGLKFEPYHGIPPDYLMKDRIVLIFVRYPVKWYRSIHNHMREMGWTRSPNHRSKLWRLLLDVMTPYRHDDFDVYITNFLRDYSGFMGRYFNQYLVPNIRVGRTENLMNDLMRLVPGVKPVPALNVIKDLKEPTEDSIRIIERSEKELIDKYYKGLKYKEIFNG